MLRTEANYDFVTVEPTGAPVQEFDGNRDDTWTAWFPINANNVKVRLETDSSITRHGFAIDQVEWNGSPICPAIDYPAVRCRPGRRRPAAGRVRVPRRPRSAWTTPTSRSAT